MKRETLIEETQGAVRTLVLNRPEARNAFDNRLYRDLTEALTAAADDDGVRAVVLTGAGSAFTAGQDLSEMARAAQSSEHGFPACIERVACFDKPLLAAVNGVGVGLGLTILLHCDVVYIAQGARLRAPFVALGVVPEAASSYLLPRVVGDQRAAEIFFTGDWITSARAVEIGVATRELPPDVLLPALRELAARIAGHPLGALRDTKRLLLATRADAVRAARAREDEVFQRRLGSPENLDAIRDFFAQRKSDASKRDSG